MSSIKLAMLLVMAVTCQIVLGCGPLPGFADRADKVLRPDENIIVYLFPDRAIVKLFGIYARPTSPEAAEVAFRLDRTFANVAYVYVWTKTSDQTRLSQRARKKTPREFSWIKRYKVPDEAATLITTRLAKVSHPMIRLVMAAANNKLTSHEFHIEELDADHPFWKLNNGTKN